MSPRDLSRIGSATDPTSGWKARGAWSIEPRRRTGRIALSKPDPFPIEPAYRLGRTRMDGPTVGHHEANRTIERARSTRSRRRTCRKAHLWISVACS